MKGHLFWEIPYAIGFLEGCGESVKGFLGNIVIARMRFTFGGVYAKSQP